MDKEPKSGSTEEMRHFINIVTVGPEGKEVRSGFAFGSCWAKIIAILTAGAIILGGLGEAVHGIDAGYDFGCKVGWWTGGCQK